MYEYRRGGSVFGAFLLGGMVGAVLGLLFAPRSGKETRDMLAERADEYWGQAGDLYATGKEKVGAVYETGVSSATDKSEELRSKIDEARSRLQEQVAKSAETARDKIADAAPAVKEVVDKAAESTKSGVDKAASKAGEGLDFVAKKAAKMGSDEAPAGEPVVEPVEAPAAPEA